MILELAAFLLGVCVGVVAVLFAAQEGYLGHRRRKASIDLMTSFETSPPKAPFIPKMEEEAGVPAVVATTVAEPAPSPITPTYETVQSNPAPLRNSTHLSTSFRAPTMTKPTRTYRRRAAPVWNTHTASMASVRPRTRKTLGEKAEYHP